MLLCTVHFPDPRKDALLDACTHALHNAQLPLMMDLTPPKGACMQGSGRCLKQSLERVKGSLDDHEMQLGL